MKKTMIIIGDGMSDLPVDQLGGLTPLEASEIPNMDRLAQSGVVGLTRNVPEGMEPGSDVAIMSIMGYNPKECYTGRGPIEAASIGVDIKSDETAFRCNLISVEEDILSDYSGGHIETEDAAQLIAALQEAGLSPDSKFISGVSFRHLLLLKGDFTSTKTYPPHDHIGGKWTEWLPTGAGSEKLIEIIKKSQSVLNEHPLNIRRKAAGKAPANSAWPWSGGISPRMLPYSEKYGVTGSVISAVDLVQGLGRIAGLDIIKVAGATGMVDTNYEGKVAAALSAIHDKDLVVLHLEGTDEAAHMGSLELKMEGIRRLDRLVVGPVSEYMKKFDDYVVLILPDHPTPISIRTHTSDAVPFLICSPKPPFSSKTVDAFSERTAASTGLIIDNGYELLGRLLK